MAKLKTKPEFELAKRLPGASQIERVRAARAMIHSRRGSESMALFAFMDIFHSGYDPDKVRDMARDLRDRERRR